MVPPGSVLSPPLGMSVHTRDENGLQLEDFVHQAKQDARRAEDAEAMGTRQCEAVEKQVPACRFVLCTYIHMRTSSGMAHSVLLSR